MTEINNKTPFDPALPEDFGTSPAEASAFSGREYDDAEFPQEFPGDSFFMIPDGGHMTSSPNLAHEQMTTGEHSGETKDNSSPKHVATAGPGDSLPGAEVTPATTAGAVGQIENPENMTNPQEATPIVLSDWERIPGAEDAPELAEGEFGHLPKLPKKRFADRELSWLAFNERVLEQAEDASLPLLERAWFLTIFTSNLDEFYMVRVAGLKRRIATGLAVSSASGLTATQLHDEIRSRAQELCERHAQAFQDDIGPALAKKGIHIKHWDCLTELDQQHLTSYFRHRIFPVLTPLAVDPSHPFPYISGLSLNLAVIVRNPVSGKTHFARVKIPPLLPRLIAVHVYDPNVGTVPTVDAPFVYVPLEEVISAHLDHLFPGMEIVEKHTFRVTRNEDLEVEEDDAENLLAAMEKELMRRRFGPAVRLEVATGISKFMQDFLVQKLEISAQDVYTLPAPLDLRCLNELHDLDIPKLKYKKYVPVTAAGLAEVESATPGDIFASIRNHDVLLHHPYDSFSTSVQHFIATAAADRRVLALKQTLYRTSGDSPIIDALIDAAEAGKQVLAIVEIKARFDEEANITWARKLERAGVHVVYGMVGLKTHCKLSLVVRQEGELLRRYCHVGTGNYHPKTARGYEDYGLLTCDPQVGQDLTRLFNQLSGYAPRATFHRLLVAPRSIRNGLLEQIEQEMRNKLAGKEAWIRIKVNSLVDETIIDTLYRASQVGVPVDIVVRGICAIRPGIPGVSENIRVRSILGRYLEHSRIFAFANDGDPKVWIGSADLMHRNLDRRVEALVSLADKSHVDSLLELLELSVADTTATWHLQPDGIWLKRHYDEEGKHLDDIQEILMARASARVSGR